MTFKAPQTQEELDSLVKDMLNRQWKVYESELQKAEQLKVQNIELTEKVKGLITDLETDNSTQQDNEKTIDDLQQQIAGYETTVLRGEDCVTSWIAV